MFSDWLRLILIILLVTILTWCVATMLAGIGAITTTGALTANEIGHESMSVPGLTALDYVFPILLEGVYPDFWHLVVQFVAMVPAMLLAILTYNVLRKSIA